IVAVAPSAVIAPVAAHAVLAQAGAKQVRQKHEPAFLPFVEALIKRLSCIGELFEEWPNPVHCVGSPPHRSIGSSLGGGVSRCAAIRSLRALARARSACSKGGQFRS